MEKIGRYKPGQNVTVAPDGELVSDQLKAARFVAITNYDENTRTYLASHAEPGDPHPFGVTQRDSANPAVEDSRSVDLLVECMTGGIPFVEAGEVIDTSSGPVDVAVGADGKAVVAGGDSAATLKTGVVGNNNAITWTANDAGADGNALSVTLVDPPGNNVALSVDVDGNEIVVTLATDGTSVVTSTAAQVIAAVAEHDTASQLVTASNTAGSSGAGVVAAVAKASLAGGSDAEGPTAAVGKALTSADEAGKFVEVDFY